MRCDFRQSAENRCRAHALPHQTRLPCYMNSAAMLVSYEMSRRKTPIRQSCRVAGRIGNLHLRGRPCSDHWGFTTKRKTAIINLAIGGEEWDLVRTHQAADEISHGSARGGHRGALHDEGAFAYSQAPSDRL